MTTRYKARGIIIKKKERGENDQIISIYSDEFGRVEVIGRSIRKIKSKLRSSVEIFNFIDFEFIQGKTFKTLTDAKIINDFRNIKNFLEKTRIGFKMVEIVDILIKEEERDEKVWKFIVESFIILNDLENKNSFIKVFYYFVWRLLSLLGYRPNLLECISCQKKIKEDSFLNLKGEIICNECHKSKSFLVVKKEIIKLLKIILQKDFSFFQKVKLEQIHLKDLKIITKKYFLYINE